MLENMLQTIPEDQLPPSICTKCHTTVSDFVEFRKKCVNAQEKLLKYLYNKDLDNTNEDNQYVLMVMDPEPDDPVPSTCVPDGLSAEHVVSLDGGFMIDMTFGKAGKPENIPAVLYDSQNKLVSIKESYVDDSVKEISKDDVLAVTNTEEIKFDCNQPAVLLGFGEVVNFAAAYSNKAVVLIISSDLSDRRNLSKFEFTRTGNDHSIQFVRRLTEGEFFNIEMKRTSDTTVGVVIVIHKANDYHFKKTGFYAKCAVTDCRNKLDSAKKTTVTEKTETVVSNKEVVPDIGTPPKNDKSITKTQWKCPICGSYTRYSKLKFHMKVIHDRETALCFECCEGVCVVTATEKELFEKHRSLHSSSKIDKVELCKNIAAIRSLPKLPRFASTNSERCFSVCLSVMMLEKLIVSDIDFLKCPFCKVFVRNDEMISHQWIVHQQSMAICNACPMLFPYNSLTNKRLIGEHLNLHSLESGDHFDQALADNARSFINYLSFPDIFDLYCGRKKSLLPPPKRKKIKRKVYQCRLCPEKFFNRENFQTHVKDHLTCHICSESFLDMGTYRKHVGQCSKTMSWICDKCGFISKRHHSYYQHMLEVHDEEIERALYQCNECPKKFTTVRDMLCHRNYHSNIADHLLCHECGEGFNTRPKFDAHMAFIHKIGEVKCRECDARFSDRPALMQHRKSHHSGIKRCVCDICGRKLTTKNNLRKHVQILHAESDKSLKESCVLCGAEYCKFYINKHLNKHLKAGHAVCTTCGEPFPRNEYTLDRKFVKTHMKTHTDNGDSIFHEDYELPTNLNKPYQWENRLYCSLCKTRFPDAKAYEHHDAMHVKRQFSCSVCFKKFTTQWHCKNHELVHSGLTPYKCSACNKLLPHKTAKKLHEKRCTAFQSKRIRIENQDQEQELQLELELPELPTL